FTGIVGSIARDAHMALLTGVVGRADDGMPLNSALLTGSDGRIVSRYDKVHLVPFGEFVPWPFGLLTKKVSSEAGDFEAGRTALVSQLNDHKLGIFICYESVFPSYVRRGAVQYFQRQLVRQHGRSLPAPAHRKNARGGKPALDCARDQRRHHRCHRPCRPRAARRCRTSGTCSAPAL